MYHKSNVSKVISENESSVSRIFVAPKPDWALLHTSRQCEARLGFEASQRRSQARLCPSRQPSQKRKRKIVEVHGDTALKARDVLWFTTTATWGFKLSAGSSSRCGDERGKRRRCARRLGLPLSWLHNHAPTLFYVGSRTGRVMQ